jgi:hypothetical protein
VGEKNVFATGKLWKRGLHRIEALEGRSFGAVLGAALDGVELIPDQRSKKKKNKDRGEVFERSGITDMQMKIRDGTTNSINEAPIFRDEGTATQQPLA